MKRQTVIIIVVIGLVLSGCKGQKLLTGDKEELATPLGKPDMIKKKIINHNTSDTTIIFKNIKIKYSSDEISHNLYASAKFIKDTAILVSLRAPLGIEISRVLFRPYEVLVLDRKGNRFLKGDYSYLEERFKLDLNFNLVYNLLVGNFPKGYQFFERYKNFNAIGKTETQDSLYVGEFYHSDKENYKLRLWVHASFIRPEAYVFYKKRNLADFSVRYFDYLNNSGFYIPSKLRIDGGQKKKSYRIDINYRNIEFSSDKRVHFEIPAKFKKIDLK